MAEGFKGVEFEIPWTCPHQFESGPCRFLELAEKKKKKGRGAFVGYILGYMNIFEKMCNMLKALYLPRHESLSLWNYFFHWFWNITFYYFWPISIKMLIIWKFLSQNRSHSKWINICFFSIVRLWHFWSTKERWFSIWSERIWRIYLW